tara:strand:+ start:63 stop:344 length:282 start_codon:yes stop_codon:yes gene_type:complete
MSEYTGETTELSIFPKGKAGAKMVYQLSQNIRPEHQEKYISIGVLASAYPDLSCRKIVELVEEFGPELITEDARGCRRLQEKQWVKEGDNSWL